MIGLDELTRRVAALDRVELERWIENRWILPDEESGTYQTLAGFVMLAGSTFSTAAST